MKKALPDVLVGAFFVQMYGGYVESLGIIHDCQFIAAIVNSL
jgi:hypothetical protein